MIPGGATIWARQTMDSEIFQKPDKWFKVWFYLVNQVNYKDNGQFKRGRGFVTYRQIMDSTGATKGQVKHCIEYLKARHTIATQKATRGMIVTVINYDTYQDLTTDDLLLPPNPLTITPISASVVLGHNSSIVWITSLFSISFIFAFRYHIYKLVYLGHVAGRFCS